MPATLVSFDGYSCEEAFRKDSQLLCSANSPPTTKLFTHTAFCSYWEFLINSAEIPGIFAHYPHKQGTGSKKFINQALQVTRLRYKQIKRHVQSHAVNHFCHCLQDFWLSGPDPGCYMIMYCNLYLVFDQGNLVLLASVDFVSVLFLPRDDTVVQYPNSSCDKCLFVQEDPRSWKLIQKIVSQWIISDDVFKKKASYHRWAKVHITLAVDPSVCHIVFVVTSRLAFGGERWRLPWFLEHCMRIREETRMWHSARLFVWGGLCTAIALPKGWNIFFCLSTFQQLSRQ